MLESSLRVGTVAGIRIGVHYTWFIVFLLLTFSLTAYFHLNQPDWSDAAALATATATSLLFFASIVLHELGHSLVAISRGVPVRSITLFIFGGVAQTDKDADSAATEFWIAVAGPAVSLGLAGVFYLLARATAAWAAPASEACLWLAEINLVVAAFNLLPGFPLDGGRVFRAAVWALTGNAGKGMSWAVAAGRAVAYGLMLLGLVIALRTGLLINGLWMAAIGWFLLMAGGASARAYAVKQLLRGVVARDIMQHRVPSVSASLNIQEWVDASVLATGERASLVTDDGRVVGLVTLTDSRKLARSQWPGTTLGEIMTPVRALRTANPQTPASDILDLMQRYAFNQIPVVQNGEIQGWIDRTRLLQVLQLHSELGR